MSRLELQERQTQVEICQISSPVNGMVIERFKGPGEYVQETEIPALAQIDPLHVEVVVPERYFGRIRIGMTADVRRQQHVPGAGA